MLQEPVGVSALSRRGGVDANALERGLRAAIVGEVRFDAGRRALYATDASSDRQVPMGVLIPRSVDDLVRAVALCREHGAPILPPAAGTFRERHP